jgi:hypothetical protein
MYLGISTLAIVCLDKLRKIMYFFFSSVPSLIGTDMRLNTRKDSQQTNEICYKIGIVVNNGGQL